MTEAERVALLHKMRRMLGNWYEHRTAGMVLHLVVIGFDREVIRGNGSYSLHVWYKGGPRPDEWGIGYLNADAEYRKLEPSEIGVGIR